MLRINHKALVALSTLLLPSAAMASFAPVVVTLGTPAASPVPAMSSGLVVALGLLLAAIGYRFMRRRPACQKLLSLLVLGCGMLLGALGVDRTIAIVIPEVPPEDPACTGGEANLITGSPFAGNLFKNGCEFTSLEVKAYQNLPCAAEDWIVTDADIGAKIPAGGEATTNYCPPP